MTEGIISIIPARSGSKGVPNKNIKLLAGHPLIAFSIASSKLSSKIERTIVSTDSKEIADIALSYGAEVPFLRPSEISGDRSTDYDVIIHTLNWLQTNESYQPTHIIYLRPTTPFRELMHIDSAIKSMEKNRGATALRSVHKMSQSSYKTLEIEAGYLKCICNGSFDVNAANRPRQEYAETYDANGYVDIFRTSFIIGNERLLGDRVLAYVTPHISEVDTLEEFNYLEYQITKNPDVVNRLLEGM
jgi:N-acylneuraminate cytidylyltransferase